MLTNYLKMAVNVLKRRKFFTFISLFGISFTLMVLMVAAALLDHIFAPRAPEVNLDRTLGVFSVSMRHEQGGHTGPPGYRFLDRYLRTLPDVERVTLFTVTEKVFGYHDGRKVTTWRKRTDGQFWDVYKFDFLEGRPFTAADDQAANFVAVINESTRRAYFDGQPAVGKSIEIDGQRFRVVGVVGDVPMTRLMPFADMWVPISTMPGTNYKNEMVGQFFGIVLAKSAADLPRLRAEFDRRLPLVELPDPKTWKWFEGGLETPFEAISRILFRTQRPGTLRSILLGLMLLFMTLPALNLISINTSRIMERASEIGVRKSFGASSRTLVGQFLVENVVLTLVGGLLGLFLSGFVLFLMNRADLIPHAQFSLNIRIFLYGMALAVLFGILSGVYPAWRMSRMHPVQALRGGAA